MAEGGGASLTDIVRNAQRRKGIEPNPYRSIGVPESHQFDSSQDAFGRMFASRLGSIAAGIVGNEEKTLGILETISTETVLATLELQGVFGPRGILAGDYWRAENGLRAVVVPSGPKVPSALVILDPWRSVDETEDVTSRTRLDRAVLERIAYMTFRNSRQEVGDTHRVHEFLLSSGGQGLAEALWITQPDIVISRRPKMIPLCAPWPSVTVMCGTERSTAGIFCRDSTGTVGITACYHGTGPVGTPVQVGRQQSTVTIANNIQDMVFIPLDQNYVIPSVRGTAGILRDRAPGLYDQVEFHGASSGATKTQIASYDAGILRSRPTIQLRVQTGADSNAGDSGAALVNEDDKVIGFAFERTAFGDKPEMTDWIWAANALNALGLTPM